MKRWSCEVGASPHPPYLSRAAIRADAASIAAAKKSAKVQNEDNVVDLGISECRVVGAKL